VSTAHVVFDDAGTSRTTKEDIMRPRYILTLLAICLVSLGLGACKSDKSKPTRGAPADEPAAAPEQLPDDGEGIAPFEPPPAAEPDTPAPSVQQPVEMPQEPDDELDE